MVVHSTPRSFWLCALALVAAIGAAWSNSFSGPWVLDDFGNIADNPSLRQAATMFSPPPDTGVGGRPFLNFTYACNYALGGLNVGGYHAVNLAIHVLAALVLFALVHDTLARVGHARALAIAATAAALWALHPVQTQAVTYLSQRAESLMGLLYLLVLYCAARALTSPQPRGWQIAAVIALVLGVATKEVAATAPLLVLLYDRTYHAGSFRAALRQRHGFYFALVCPWVLLAVLSANLYTRGIGTGHGVSALTYALTECRVVVDYLQLAVWPSPLIFDYGPTMARSASEVLPSAFLLLALLATTGVALARWPRVGFLGAWFFVILAPTSSVIPIAFSPQAESRLYLPLAALAIGVAYVLHTRAPRYALPLGLAGALVLGALTFVRNRDYRTDLGLWADTVAKRPGNAAAHYNYGLTLSRAGRPADAAEQWRTTLRLDPTYAAAYNNLANALASLGRYAESVPHYEAAFRLQPDASVVRANFGFVLLNLGRVAEAEAQLRLALKQNPRNASAYNNLGLVQERLGPPFTAALESYESALRLDPGFTNAHHNLALLLARTGRVPEAVAHFETIARLQPADPVPRLDAARVLLTARQPAEARARVEAILRTFPTSPEAWLMLGNSQAYLGDFPAAVAAYEKALQYRPDYPDARDNLAKIRARLPAASAR